MLRIISPEPVTVVEDIPLRLPVLSGVPGLVFGVTVYVPVFPLPVPNAVTVNARVSPLGPPCAGKIIPIFTAPWLVTAETVIRFETISVMLIVTFEMFGRASVILNEDTGVPVKGIYLRLSFEPEIAY